MCLKRLSEKLNVSEYEENTQSVKDDRSDEEIRIAIAFSGGKLKASEYEENAVMHVMLMKTGTMEKNLRRTNTRSLTN